MCCSKLTNMVSRLSTDLGSLIMASSFFSRFSSLLSAPNIMQGSVSFDSGEKEGTCSGDESSYQSSGLRENMSRCRQLRRERCVWTIWLMIETRIS